MVDEVEVVVVVELDVVVVEEEVVVVEVVVVDEEVVVVEELVVVVVVVEVLLLVVVVVVEVVLAWITRKAWAFSSQTSDKMLEAVEGIGIDYFDYSTVIYLLKREGKDWRKP